MNYIIGIREVRFSNTKISLNFAFGQPKEILICTLANKVIYMRNDLLCWISHRREILNGIGVPRKTS